ncbi:MAG: TetR/AcrR family transcriptional regulator [Muribaculaceae bacterium]|nr:TetR/AcrR family transcriptional regulator [Muribaculaceae bacterium]MDE7393053.1 TetR/AcrR family transcriptional regulator [Muribaculaceae bacterium]
MSNRTREKLIEVARHLFIRKGIENTTMVDIANASEKGRRTIYTYFKSKRAIYEAVIERESQRIIERLEAVTRQDLPPLQKLHQFIVARFEILKIATASPIHSEGIRAIFTKDNKRYDRIIANTYREERAMLNRLMRECLDDPSVDRRQVVRLRVVIPLLQTGVDISFIRDNYKELGVDEASFPNVVATFIINGLLKKDKAIQ